MNREKRTEIYSRLRKHIPDPTTELSYESEFELLIAVLVCQFFCPFAWIWFFVDLNPGREEQGLESPPQQADVVIGIR